ncbi:TRAP transporter small permease [uncultured Clostridium sp.]|uniref:TRAP transporter small permease n=1 Tax=uncultured Clostridium sp. TaxID=59620 RepID=UPI0025DB413A|nr:TRAP transporter small permease [uncultured Clostridium sp.]
MMGKVKKIVGNLDQMLMAVTMAIVCILLIVQVFFRYVLNSPLIWSEECARYMFVWTVMLGLGYNVRTKNNISVSLVTSRLPQSIQRGMEYITDLIVLASYLFCLPPIMKYLEAQSRIRSTAMRMPMGLLAVSVLIGVLSLLLQTAVSFVMKIKHDMEKRNMDKYNMEKRNMDKYNTEKRDMDRYDTETHNAERRGEE